MKRLKLDEGISFSLSGWGIVSQEKDYRLSHKLNKNLHLKLVRTSTDRFSFESGHNQKKLTFHFFDDEENGKKYYLIKNRQKDFIVLPQIKNADFIFLIEGENGNADKIRASINSLINIQGIFALPDSQIKNLSFD